eukprot:scaffold6773_cov87-Isochrysis_galbana.AAC.1
MEVGALVRHAMPPEDSQSQGEPTEADERIDAARTSLLASLGLAFSALSPPLALPDAAVQLLWWRAIGGEGSRGDGAVMSMPVAAVAALRAAGADWLADAAVKRWLERTGAEVGRRGDPGERGRRQLR